MTSVATLGPYELLGALGGGSMGVVHRARRGASGPIVALKTVHLEGAHQLANLRAEIAALARLRHPGVVAVHDHGAESGAPYLVMELVEGQSLKDALEAGAPPSIEVAGRRRVDPGALLRVLSLFARLARALAYVHGEGIVHRDLKPANVVVRPDGRPVLLDFGLARLRPGGSRESLDAQRGAIGTALYMSPEQIMGHLVDARADLYALGAMIHRAVAGSVPFIAPDAPQLLTKHLVEPPRALSALVEGVPAELDALVLGLLEKDRRRRVPYALDVVETLVALGADAPEEENAPPPRPYVYGSALLGREAAMREVQRALGAVATGHGATILVSGESGVGKTRFVAEAIESLSYAHVLAIGTCEAPVGDAEPGAGDVLSGLRPLLRAVADRARDAAADAAAWLGPDGPLLALYEPELLPFVDTAVAAPLPGAGKTHDRLVDAMLGLAGRIAAVHPLVLVIDDLQWADPVTLAWARRVAAGALAEVSVAVVLASRAEDEVVIERGPGALAFDLAPLGPPAMAEIARQMLGARDADHHALDELIAAAQGNPFALASAVRTAAEEGLLVRVGRGRWRLAPRAAVIDRMREAGSGVAAAMAGLRLRALSADARVAAIALAVMGGAAHLDDVTAVAFAGDALRCAAAFGEVSRRGVAAVTASSEVALVHDKLREAAYDAAAPTQRAALHLAAAARLVASREPTAEVMALVARHRALGDDDAGSVEADLAASAAFEARGAANDALLRAESASAAAAGLDAAAPLRRRARLRLGGLLVSLGAIPRARGLLEEALDAATRAGDVAAVAAAQVHLSYAAYVAGDVEAMFAAARAGAAAAEEAGDTRLASRAENALGIAWGSSGRFRRAISHYERAAGLARQLGDGAAVGRFLSNISINHRLLGQLDAAEQAAREALERTRSAPTTHANAWCNLGRILLEAGRGEDAEQAFDRALELASRTHNAIVGAEATWGLALTALTRGEPQAAEARAERSLAIAREGEMATAEALALRALGWIRALDGPPGAARAREALDRSVAMLEETAERDELADSLRARALVRLRAGDEEGGAADRARARAVFEELEMLGRLRAIDAPLEEWTCS